MTAEEETWDRINQMVGTRPRPAPPEIDHSQAIADYLEVQVRTMRKRVWIPNEDNRAQEMKDGAVPCWWLEQEIKRLRKVNDRNQNRTA